MSSCGSDISGSGLFDGEELLSVVRVLTTVISLTVTSAWFSWEKITKLSLFFTHWLSGLVAGLGFIVESAMVALCWTSGSGAEGLVKALKFIELSASNMYAITNLAICINLAFIVMSHRTMSHVESVSSPPLLVGFLGIATALAAPIIPLTESILTTGTGFFVLNATKRDDDFIQVSFFYVEFFVGICMFFIVAWLMLFWLEEVKECWKIHPRVRFYFLLTLSGIFINLGVGVCGMINVLVDEFMFLLHSWGWSFRFIHFALDTIVLYAVLRVKGMDERGGDNVSQAGSRTSRLSSGRRLASESNARRSGKFVTRSKPGSFTPPV